MRTSRTNGVSTYTYVYNGGKLSKMHVLYHTMEFTYDADGKPFSLIYNGDTYYYVTNLQGDVVAVVGSGGTVVVRYTYDAWGRVLTISGGLAMSIGHLNPLRYRGYVYDTDTELYYLQSRYYDPEMGRFINADAFTSTGQGLLGNNTFSYCKNNPPTMIDPSGTICAICYSDNPFVSLYDPSGGGGCSVPSVIAYQYAQDASAEYCYEEGYSPSDSNKYGADIRKKLGYCSSSFLTIENDGVNLWNFEAGLAKYSMSWWEGLLSVIPIDFFGAKSGAGLSLSEGVNFSALAYAASATGKIDLGFLDVSATGYLGAVGIELAFGFDGITVGGAYNGVGCSISICWDND